MSYLLAPEKGVHIPGFEGNENNEAFDEIYSDLMGNVQMRRDVEGPFLGVLMEKLRDQQGRGRIFRVLETAAGRGLEVRWLREIKGQIETLINERDVHMRRRLINDLLLEQIILAEEEVTDCHWKDLPDHPRYKGREGTFNLVLKMGNSLAMLEKEDEQVEALRAAHRMTDPGFGALIVDARNYPELIRRVRALVDKKSPVTPQTFDFPAGAICNGPVHGVPVRIPSDLSSVTMRYDGLNGEEAYASYSCISPDQMRGMLQRAGFQKTYTFYDYYPSGRKGRHQKLTRGDRANSGFYQCVAVRNPALDIIKGWPLPFHTRLRA